MEAQAKELGIHDKLKENFAIMRREAVDDLEIGSEILGAITLRERALRLAFWAMRLSGWSASPIPHAVCLHQTLPTDLLAKNMSLSLMKGQEKEFVDDHGVTDFITRFGVVCFRLCSEQGVWGGSSARKVRSGRGGAAGIEDFSMDLVRVMVTLRGGWSMA